MTDDSLTQEEARVIIACVNLLKKSGQLSSAELLLAVLERRDLVDTREQRQAMYLRQIFHDAP